MITEITLWQIGSGTEKAYLFSRLPPERNPTSKDNIWIPKSIIEHITRFPEKDGYRMCNIKLPDWFLEKNGL